MSINQMSFRKDFHDKIINGKKTQTRRPVDPQLKEYDVIPPCPYGGVGHKLQVRDTDILLEITDIRIERLFDISDGDVDREGVSCDEADCLNANCAIEKFISIWNEIYTDCYKPQFKWSENPLVWVINFKRYEK